MQQAYPQYNLPPSRVTPRCGHDREKMKEELALCNSTANIGSGILPGMLGLRDRSPRLSHLLHRGSKSDTDSSIHQPGMYSSAMSRAHSTPFRDGNGGSGDTRERAFGSEATSANDFLRASLTKASNQFREEINASNRSNPMWNGTGCWGDNASRSQAVQQDCLQERQKEGERRLKQDIYRASLERQVEQKNRRIAEEERKFNTHPLGPNYDQANPSWQNSIPAENYSVRHDSQKQGFNGNSPRKLPQYQVPCNRMTQALANLQSSRTNPETMYSSNHMKRNDGNAALNASNTPRDTLSVPNFSNFRTLPQSLERDVGGGGLHQTLSRTGEEVRREVNPNCSYENPNTNRAAFFASPRPKADACQSQNTNLPNGRINLQNMPASQGTQQMYHPHPYPGPVPFYPPYPQMVPSAFPYHPQPGYVPSPPVPVYPQSYPQQQHQHPPYQSYPNSLQGTPRGSQQSPRPPNGTWNQAEGEEGGPNGMRKRGGLSDEEILQKTAELERQMRSDGDNNKEPRMPNSSWMWNGKSLSNPLKPSRSMLSDIDRLKNFVERKLAEGNVDFDGLRENLFGKPNKWQTTDDTLDLKPVKDMINRAELADQIRINQQKKAEAEAKDKEEEDRLDKRIREFNEIRRQRDEEQMWIQMEKSKPRRKNVPMPIVEPVKRSTLKSRRATPPKSRSRSRSPSPMHFPDPEYSLAQKIQRTTPRDLENHHNRLRSPEPERRRPPSRNEYSYARYIEEFNGNRPKSPPIPTLLPKNHEDLLRGKLNPDFSRPRLSPSIIRARTGEVDLRTRLRVENDLKHKLMEDGIHAISNHVMMH